MTWEVRLHSAFEDEVLAFERDVRIALAAAAKLLADFGPQLGRPHADTLKGREAQSCSSPATSRVEARSASTGA